MFSRTSIKRPVATIMVLIITIMTGLVACFSLKMDLMPNVDMPIAVVSTTYVGAGPEEVETLERILVAMNKELMPELEF